MSNIDSSSLHKIEYGLYAVTCHDGKKGNALIVNTVIQQASSPLTISVTINKLNYSHDVILNTRKLNVCSLSIDTPFSIFEQLGFSSGRDKDKLKDVFHWTSANGLPVLSGEIANAFFSLEVESYVDLGSHGMFICKVTEATTMSDVETMTYSYYHKNVKPKPGTSKKKGFVCTICGYVYEGDTLPEDFVCPLCKHDSSDFVPIE